MRDLPTTTDFGDFYNASKAASELRSYRNKGPIPSTRMLIDALKTEGVEGVTYHHSDFLELAETIPPAEDRILLSRRGCIRHLGRVRGGHRHACRTRIHGGTELAI
jgi:hypothetical protein